MNRVFGFFITIGWFALISALWLGAIGLSASFLLQHLYAFNPLLPTSWQLLLLGFQQGEAIPLGFILLCLALASLALIGEVAILWRLPTIIARLPALCLPRAPRLSLRLPKLPARKPQATKNLAPVPTPPTPAPAQRATIQDPAPLPEEEKLSNDAAILARVLALFEVWNEPPPSWMAEALRDEVHLLSPNAWPTLESLGSHGLDLLVTLQEHGMLPESPVALQAIGEVETVLRAGLAAEAAQPQTSSPIPILTLAASWLCEALENFLAAQEEGRHSPEQLTMAQEMLKQAMRGMGEEDWASLDQFPEKASRVRVLTDRLREELREDISLKPASPTPQTPSADPAVAILALLERFGFTVEGGLGLTEAPFLARRPDLLVLLQIIDLGSGSWRLAQGLLGLWSSPAQGLEISPGRQLWQLLARRRLRHADPRPLAGLLVLHGGRIEEEEILAEQVAADRRRSLIGLAWLEESGGPLPGLERGLRDLTEQAVRGRPLQRSEGYSAAPS